MPPDPLAALWPPEWRAWDAVARALPDCEHNRAWRQLGPGRGDTPDCAHNLEHRAAVAAAWSAFLAARADAVDAVAAVPVVLVMDPLFGLEALP